MYIGTLTNPESRTDITYSYKKRGLDIEYKPDLISEDASKSLYTVKDRLFSDFIGFDGTVLLDRGIDICINLAKCCFVDSISFELGEDAEAGEIRVLIPNGSQLKYVGKLSPQSGKNITDKKICIAIGVNTDKLVLRINGVYKHLIIGKLDITGAVNLDEALYPIPEEVTYCDGYYVGGFDVKADGQDAVFAASDFKDKLSELSDICVNSDLSNVEFKIGDLGEEEYSLCVTPEYISLVGGSRRALIYGSEKLLQLITSEGVRCCTIKDKPFMKIRGVHIALPNRDKIDFLKRVIKYMIAPLGYNNVFIQLSATMEYKSHPEINESWKFACDSYRRGEYPRPAHFEFLSQDILTQDEVRDICSYIRSYGLEIIPEVQTFGHTQYITMAHPELAEIDPDEDEVVDLFVADIMPKKFYKHCMCPNHPDYYKMTFDIIDEVIDVMKPEKYLHIGHDEIYVIGKCDRCRDIPDDEILATEVTKLNDHIKSHGLTTMMWSDMIQDAKYTTVSAISKIPKDVICLSFIWYFHLDKNIEEMLYDNGLRVMHGNFYSSHFPRFNSRKSHPMFMGAQTSTWVNFNEEILSFKGKMYDIVYDANMFWNCLYNDKCILCYDILADKFLQNSRTHISENVITGKTISVEFKKSTSSVPFDICEDYASALCVSAGESRMIDCDIQCKKIAFVHSTNIGGDHIVWKNPEPIADYILHYSDGTNYSHTIGYGVGIMQYKRRYAKALESDLYRHEGYLGTGMLKPFRGKTTDGEDYTVYEYTIANPYPEKKISGIEISHRGTMDAAIILYDIKQQID